MHVRRGRATTIDADRETTEAVVAHAATEREQALRVWCPHRQVAFGRRDAHAEGYESARAAAEDRGFPATTRDVGGRAVAFTGTTTALVYAIPVESARGDIDARYATATETLRSAFDSLGVDARPGEPADSFCPGTHSLQAGGKLAGLAQRVTADVATVAAVVVVTDREAFAGVLDRVYHHLGVPFDPDSVGSVERAGGPADPAVVGDALVAAFSG